MFSSSAQLARILVGRSKKDLILIAVYFMDLVLEYLKLDVPEKTELIPKWHVAYNGF